MKKPNFTSIFGRLKTEARKAWDRHGPAIKKTVGNTVKQLLKQQLSGKSITPTSILRTVAKQGIKEGVSNEKAKQLALRTIENAQGFDPKSIYTAIPRAELSRALFV